jgi:hypothetical protein
VADYVTATEIQPGMVISHSGEMVEVADVEICDWIVKVATMSGGHVSFPTGSRVYIKACRRRRRR